MDPERWILNVFVINPMLLLKLPAIRYITFVSFLNCEKGELFIFSLSKILRELCRSIQQILMRCSPRFNRISNKSHTVRYKEALA